MSATAFSLCKLLLVSACPRQTGGIKIPKIKKIVACENMLHLNVLFK
jgi:hypothetical protein